MKNQENIYYSKIFKNSIALIVLPIISTIIFFIFIFSFLLTLHFFYSFSFIILILLLSSLSISSFVLKILNIVYATKLNNNSKFNEKFDNIILLFTLLSFFLPVFCFIFSIVLVVILKKYVKFPEVPKGNFVDAKILDNDKIQKEDLNN